MRTFEDIFSGDATSHVLEWPLGRVHKRAVESTVDTTDAMDAGDDDEESSSGIPLSAEEAAGFWLGDAAYPIQTCLLDGYHAIDRVGDRIPRPNTLREKFISRMRDVLYIICPEDVDEHDSCRPTSTHTHMEVPTTEVIIPFRNHAWMIVRRSRGTSPPLTRR